VFKTCRAVVCSHGRPHRWMLPRSRYDSSALRVLIPIPRATWMAFTTAARRAGLGVTTLSRPCRKVEVVLEWGQAICSPTCINTVFTPASPTSPCVQQPRCWTRRPSRLALRCHNLSINSLDRRRGGFAPIMPEHNACNERDRLC